MRHRRAKSWWHLVERVKVAVGERENQLFSGQIGPLVTGKLPILGYGVFLSLWIFILSLTHLGVKKVRGTCFSSKG